MYTKDLVKRVTIRLDEPLAKMITENSSATGQTPSEWVRMVLHSYMHFIGKLSSVSEAVADDMLKPLARTEKAAKNENKKTNKHNRV